MLYDSNPYTVPREDPPKAAPAPAPSTRLRLVLSAVYQIGVAFLGLGAVWNGVSPWCLVLVFVLLFLGPKA